MSYLFLIIIAILPSVIWLLFYLRKDDHPESNLMILKIFFWGMMIALPATFTELGFLEQITEFSKQVGKAGFSPLFLTNMLNTFVGVALVEEFFKYLVVRLKVIKSSELDEPLDIMLYMIIAALGFAALENIAKFLSPDIFNLRFKEALLAAAFIFISSTFLHALTSGTLGFFLALSFYEPKKSLKDFLYFPTGISLATLLHGLYNLSIMKISESYELLNSDFFIFSSLIVMILGGLAISVIVGFKKLKKMKSVCKI